MARRIARAGSAISTTSCAPAARAPARIAARIGSGSSNRGWWSATITVSAPVAAACPMALRLLGSRSPSAPSTITTGPRVNARTAARLFANASGVCAKSTNTRGPVGADASDILPGMTTSRRGPRASASASNGTPASTSMTIASPVFAAMWTPRSGTSVVSDRPSGPWRQNRVRSARCSMTRTCQSAEVSARLVIVATGTSAVRTMRAPACESRDATPQRARSVRNSAAFAAR